jgi:hypothetical protein
MTTKLVGTLRQVAEEAFRLGSIMETAEDVQWMPSSVPRPREDTTERASGGYSDPTLNTVTDPRRLAVREVMVKSEAALAETRVTIIRLREELESVLENWNGGY